MSSQLERIIAEGTYTHTASGPVPKPSNKITCMDGFKLSVIAGGGSYSIPRFTDDGPYVSVEVGFPSARPEPWGVWEEFAERADDPTGTVYGFVPVELVRALIESHGGAA